MIRRVLIVAACAAMAIAGMASPTMAAPLSGDSVAAAADCYTAQTYSAGFSVDSSSDYVLTPILKGSAHCKDVNMRRTGASSFRACVIRTYQNQTNCSPYTTIGTSWVVPSGGAGIPDGAAFRVKLLGGPLVKPLYGTVAY